MKHNVSVVMSVFNGSEFLIRSIESILCQNLESIEFVIIDDGSTDDSIQIINKYARSDQRIRCLRRNNGGLTSALNLGIEHTSCPYIARQDADDFSMPDRLAKQLAFLEDNRNVGLVGTGFADVDENLNILRSNCTVLLPSAIRQALIMGNSLCHSSIMFRKDIFEKIGGYRKEFRYSQDYMLYFDFLRFSEIAILPEILVHRLVTEGMITRRHSRSQRFWSAIARHQAICAGLYGITAYGYVLRALTGNLLPIAVKRYLDNFRYGP